MKELGRQVEFDFTIRMKKEKNEKERKDEGTHEIKDTNSCSTSDDFPPSMFPQGVCFAYFAKYRREHSHSLLDTQSRAHFYGY